MSIHRTGNGRYRVRWRINRRIKSKNFQRKIDAERFEAQTKLGLQPTVMANGEQLTFAGLAQRWLRDHAAVHKAPSSIIRDKQTIRDHLNPQIGHFSIDGITRMDLVKLQAWLNRSTNLAPKSINSATSLAHKILDDAVSWGLLQTNPAHGIKRIKCPEIDYKFWTFADRDKFLNYCLSRNKVLHDIVLFAVHTGLRRGEVEGLCRDCLDFNRREIIVKRSFCHKVNSLNEYTKGKNIRRVPMNDAVFSILKDKQLLPPTSTVFDVDFEHVVWRRFKPMQKASGVNCITYHDLRHSFASMLAMRGISIFDIQKLLGHADLKTTQRYMHLSPDHLQGRTDVLLNEPLVSGLTKVTSVR